MSNHIEPVVSCRGAEKKSRSLLVRVGISLGISLGLVACGGAPAMQPGTANTAPPTTQTQAATLAVADAPTAPSYDVSPVAEVKEVVFQARWQSPADTLSVLSGFAQLPSNVVGAGTRDAVRELISDALEEDADIDAFADTVDIDAPMDVIVVVDTSRGGSLPEPMAAFSIGLNSLERAKSAIRGRSRKLADGVWRIGPDREWGDVCALAAAAGKAPARLVCGDKEKDVVLLAPYLARNVAAQPAQNVDMRAELRLRGLFDKFGRTWSKQAMGLPIFAEELKIGNVKFDTTLMEAAEALAIEAGGLIEDADGALFEMDADSQTGLTFRSQLRFVGKKSWTVQSVVDGAHLAGPAPEIFWRLPKSSATASYGHSADPSRYEGILKTGRILGAGLMEKEKFASAGDRAALVKLLRLPIAKYAPVASASGTFASKPRVPGKDPTLQEILDSSLGWYMLGFEQKPNDLRTYLNEAVRTYNRPTLQRVLKKEAGSDAKNMPKVRVRPAPRGFGAGSMAIEVTVPEVDETTGNGTTNLTFHVLMMADGGRTWIGIASQKAELTKLMNNIKSNTDTLAGVRNLEAFKRGSHSGASFTNVNGMLGSMMPMLDMFTMAEGNAQENAAAQRIRNATENLPNNGETPVMSFVDVRDSAKPQVSITVSFPSGVLQDAGFLTRETIKALEDQP